MNKRTIAAALIWIIIIAAFVFAFRSSMVTTVLLQRFKESMPPDQVKQHLLASEFAREYVNEWATWSPDENSDDRARRLKIFNNWFTDMDIAQAEQPFKPTSTTTKSCRKIEDNEYLVNVLVLGGPNPLTFETKVGFTKDNLPYAITKPLLRATLPTEVKTENKLYGRTGEQVKVFVQRFLEAYLEGKTLSDTVIFTTPGTNIQPTGTARLVKVNDTYSDGNRLPEKIRVNYQITVQDSTTVIKQQMIMSLTWENGKPLINHIGP